MKREGKEIWNKKYSVRKVLKVCWWENIFKALMQAQLKEKENNEEKEEIGSRWVDI